MSPVGKNFGKLNLDLPCIAASVSKPEPYADKLGVNSVNTEFSFIGTHKSFKQRFGVQNSSSLSEQEPKRNNIVSSMTSFIPLVQ
ncbi:hypothetical protein DVH24_034239 [Malus domestica]|uniref:Uncharacterized protein n=1 Tax=Malus domestica TaxID=3750 RepID=A0A498KP72_MALDO|nr:hypothetical protein DVH24_034239 [Malus domestica]